MVKSERYLYRSIGKTYASLPGRAGGLPVLINDELAIPSDHIALTPCGNVLGCEYGSTNCNIIGGNVCTKGNGWLYAHTLTENTIVEDYFSPKGQYEMYKLRDFLIDTTANEIAVRAYRHWDHLRFDAVALNLYKNFLDLIFPKLKLIYNSSGTNEIIITEEVYQSYMDIFDLYNQPDYASRKYQTLRADMAYVADKLSDVKGMSGLELNSYLKGEH